jgi:hypothetical protein
MRKSKERHTCSHETSRGRIEILGGRSWHHSPNELLRVKSPPHGRGRERLAGENKPLLNSALFDVKTRRVTCPVRFGIARQISPDTGRHLAISDPARSSSARSHSRSTLTWSAQARCLLPRAHARSQRRRSVCVADTQLAESLGGNWGYPQSME